MDSWIYDLLRVVSSAPIGSEELLDAVEELCNIVADGCIAPAELDNRLADRFVDFDHDFLTGKPLAPRILEALEGSNYTSSPSYGFSKRVGRCEGVGYWPLRAKAIDLLDVEKLADCA